LKGLPNPQVFAQLVTDGATRIYPRQLRLESYLAAAEALPNDGVTNATPLIQTAVDAAAELYQATGTAAVVVVPPGTYLLNAAITWRTGVGLAGAGRAETIFLPNGAFSAFRGGFLAASAYYTDCQFSDFTVNGALQPVESFDYGRKGFYIQRMRRSSWRRVDVVNTHATGFGVDFLESCQFVDCTAKNCGRGNTTDRFSAGAGFGFALGLSDRESIELIGCRSVGNRTHGYYMEYSPSNGATYNPVGIKLNGCYASENWAGVFDAGARCLQIVGGEYSKNLLAGVLIGQNGASTQAGLMGAIDAALIYGNGQADYAYADYHGNAVKYTAGGVVFLETANDVEYAIRGNTIIGNVGAGVASIATASLDIAGNMLAENHGGGVSIKCQSTVKRLSIKNNRICRNGKSALTTVDGVCIDAPTDGAHIIGNLIYDDAATKTQIKAITLRGLYTSTNLVIEKNQCLDAGGSGPVRVEHTAPSAVISNYTDGSTGVSVEITNLFTNPQFEVATAGTSASNCTISRPTGMSPHQGTAILRATCSNTSLAQATLAAISVTPGDVITFSAYLRCNAGRDVRLAIKDAGSSDYWTGVNVVADGNWQRHSFTFVVPAGVTSVRPSFWRGGASATNGDLLDVDSTMWTLGRDQVAYFDGATNGGTWAGTAHASTSTKTVTI
jgi:hypothetical protein